MSWETSCFFVLRSIAETPCTVAFARQNNVAADEHELVVVNIVKLFPDENVANATITSDGSMQRNWIIEQTGVNASTRQRQGWPTKQLTLQGPEGSDFAKAKTLALAAISHNFASGTT